MIGNWFFPFIAAWTPRKSCWTEAGFQSDFASMTTVRPFWIPQFGVKSIDVSGCILNVASMLLAASNLFDFSSISWIIFANFSPFNIFFNELWLNAQHIPMSVGIGKNIFPQSTRSPFHRQNVSNFWHGWAVNQRTLKIILWSFSSEKSIFSNSSVAFRSIFSNSFASSSDLLGLRMRSKTGTDLFLNSPSFSHSKIVRLNAGKWVVM